MALDVDVNICQQIVIKLDLEIKALIQDIRECDGPLDHLEELNRNVSSKIADYKNRVMELERLAKEQDVETTKIGLLKEADNYRKQLASVQAALRRANYTCQLAIESNEKEQLLHGGSEIRSRAKSSKAVLADTATGLTENLMSLSRLMSDQVKHSEQTMGVLVSSSKQVGETHEEFKNMSGHIQNSRKLLTKYGRRECTDKLLIFLALAFFFACVLYIVKKRVFSSVTDDGSYANVPPSISDTPV